MKQNQNHSLFNRYTTVALVLLIVAVASAVLVIHHNHTAATPAVKPAVGAAVPSQFTFSGATDWWQGATNKTDMALFHKIQDSCFVSIQHKTGAVDPLAEVQKVRAGLVSDGYTIVPGAIQTPTIQTSTGSRSYKLYQSSVTSPDGTSKILGGQELGYLQLSANDYLYVQGNCETADELAATIPALQAIKFNANE